MEEQEADEVSAVGEFEEARVNRTIGRHVAIDTGEVSNIALDEVATLLKSKETISQRQQAENAAEQTITLLLPTPLSLDPAPT
jgi:hypothetical protein